MGDSEAELHHLIRQKATALGVTFRGVRVVKPQPTRDGLEFVHSGPAVFVDMKDGEIILEVDNLDSLSPEDIEIIVEHEVCHIKDGQENIYGDEVYAPGSLFTKGLAQEMYQSYTEYFACQRQIQAFGRDHFSQYQLRGLSDFATMIDRFVREPSAFEAGLTTSESKKLYVVSLYKEQLKCALLDEDPQVIPPVVKDLVAPFPDCFNAIHASGLPWVEKSKLLYLVVVSHDLNIDNLRSYKRGKFTLKKYELVGNLAGLFRREGVFDERTYDVGVAVERILLDQYSHTITSAP